jgi:hypothetical protein
MAASLPPIPFDMAQIVRLVLFPCTIVGLRSGVPPVTDGRVIPHSRRTTDRVACVREEESPMLWTVAVILLVLWALGLVTSYTIGGFIHVLLVLAIITVLIRIIQGRRPI